MSDGYDSDPMLRKCEEAHEELMATWVKAKLAAYLQQENSVLHGKVRKLEIALAAEREACAKLAQDYGISRYHYEQESGKVKQDAFTAANSIAALIRGRE